MKARISIFSLLAGALLALFLSSCKPAGKQIGDIADTLAGDSTLSPEQKIALLTEQMKFSPDNYQLYYDRSLLWYESGNTVQAIADMDRVLDLSIKLPQGHHMRGFYAYVQNDDSTALKHFKHAAELGSEDPETYYSIGQIYFFRHEYPEALKWYDTAILMDSLQPQYRFAKAFLLESQGKVDESIKAYQEVLRVDPTFIKALAQLHDLFRDKKKDKAAAMAFNDRIMLIDSTHPIGRFNMGNLFMEKGLDAPVAKEEDKVKRQALLGIAVSEFSRAIQGDPKFTRAYYNRGYCFYEMQKFNRALDDFKQVTELDPYNEKAFFLMGSIYEYMDQNALALASYEQALVADPKFTDAAQAVRELKPIVEQEKAQGGGGEKAPQGSKKGF
jgi:tetratricopeptide (TPR) repeat protein